MADFERIARRDRWWAGGLAALAAGGGAVVRLRWPATPPGVVLAAAAGGWLVACLLLVLLRERLDPTLHNQSQATRLLGTAPLAAVPWIHNAADRRRRRLRVAWSVAFFAAGGGVAAAGWLW